MTGNVLLVLASFLVGWVALWPARRAMGTWDYHLAALPVGLVGWTVASGVAALAGHAMTPLLVLPSATAYAGVLFWVLWTRTGPRTGPAPAVWTSVAAGATVLAATLAAASARLTVVGYDSWAHYQASAIYMADHGLPSAITLGQYGPLIPSVIAVGRMFGGDWIYAIYPVMALDLLLLIARGVWRASVPLVGRRVAWGLSAATLLVFALTPTLLRHAFYVHSQMYSALFLTLAVVPIVLAALRKDDGAEPGSDVDRVLPTLLVSGLATAGLALTRPDGLVYVLVPLLLVIALRLERGWSARRLLYFTAPLVAVLVVSYGPAFVRLGAWQSGKLSGKVAFASLALIVAAPVAGEVLARWGRMAWLRRGHGAIRLVLAVDALAIVAAAAVAPSRFATSTHNMLTNLISTGGYGRLWMFIAGVVLVTVALGVLKCGDGPVYTLFVLAQFFAIALVVHGLSHPGRLSTADSFARVAFHIIPIALSFVAYAVAQFWPSRTAGDDTV
jgi:hypothetical protein